MEPFQMSSRLSTSDPTKQERRRSIDSGQGPAPKTPQAQTPPPTPSPKTRTHTRVEVDSIQPIPQHARTSFDGPKAWEADESPEPAETDDEQIAQRTVRNTSIRRSIRRVLKRISTGTTNTETVRGSIAATLVDSPTNAGPDAFHKSAFATQIISGLHHQPRVDSSILPRLSHAQLRDALKTVGNTRNAVNHQLNIRRSDRFIAQRRNKEREWKEANENVEELEVWWEETNGDQWRICAELMKRSLEKEGGEGAKVE